MKRLSILAFITLLALFAFGAAPSFANVERPMQSHPSPETLAGQCSANGGTFNESTDLGVHSYGCTKSNCDGKGGECRVSCGDTGCAGSTPAIVVKATIRMLLQNGSLVNHLYTESEGPSPNQSGGGKPAPGATAPAPVVPVIY